MIRLRPSGVDEVLIKRVQDWYEPGPGVFIQSLTTALFSPAMLFTGSTTGAWYDPSDITTLFQDAAGTTPVTAVEQPVGRMLDKSGRGNYAFNSSGNSANFPVLSARYNLLTKTEDFSDAVWLPNGSIAGPGQGVTVNDAIAPNGTLTADRLTFSTSNTHTWWGQSGITLTSGVSYTFSVWLKRVSGSGLIQVNTNPYGNGGSWITVAVTSNWQQFSITQTATATTTPVASAGILAVEAGQVIHAWGADLRVSNDALNQPAYQRVNTETDYDTVGFKPYLKFNGTNQWLQTNNIDFTYGDEMFVCAGVRKLSDAATARFLVELGASTNTNPGFAVLAPGTISVNEWYGFGIRGNSGVGTWVTGGSVINAPDSSVITGLGSITPSSTILRRNGSVYLQNTTSAGSGAFPYAPLYIGARAGTSLWFNGRLYQLVVAGKQASASEITNTETFINQKTGAY